MLQDLPFRKEGCIVHYGNPTKGFAIDFCLCGDGGEDSQMDGQKQPTARKFLKREMNYVPHRELL